MNVGSRFIILRNRDVKSVGNQFDMIHKNTVTIAKNKNFTTNKGAVFGFTKEEFCGLFISSNTTTDAFMVSFMRKNFIVYMENGYGIVVLN